MNLAALSAIWARRKYLALGVLAATLAAALTIAVAIPGIYRSTATVLVARPEMTTPSVRSPLTGELEARLNRIGEEILSRSRLEALLDRFDIYGPNAKADLEASVTRLRRDIRSRLRPAGKRDQGNVGMRGERAASDDGAGCFRSADGGDQGGIQLQFAIH